MDRMVLLMVVVVVLFGMLRIIRCGKEGLKNLQCCLLSCFAAAFEHSCKKKVIVVQFCSVMFGLDSLLSQLLLRSPLPCYKSIVTMELFWKYM